MRIESRIFIEMLRNVTVRHRLVLVLSSQPQHYSGGGLGEIDAVGTKRVIVLPLNMHSHPIAHPADHTDAGGQREKCV